MFQRTKGYLKRQEMVDKAVEREVKKQYPTGLAASVSGMAIRKKIRSEIVGKITTKNKDLLKF